MIGEYILRGVQEVFDLLQVGLTIKDTSELRRSARGIDLSLHSWNENTSACLSKMSFRWETHATLFETFAMYRIYIRKAIAMNEHAPES